MSKIGITIPVLNNFEGAIELIASVKSQDHDVRFYIEEQWRHQKPLAAAWNHGFDRAVADGCHYVLIANDDIVFSPNCIDNLIAEYERLAFDHEKVVLVSANNILGQLQSADDILTHEQPYAQGMVSDHPNYACFLVRRDFFDKVGRFDENHAPAWCEDQDSHQRIELLGYRAVCTTAASCVHIGGVTTSKLGAPDSTHSVNYFIKKWGSHHDTPPQDFTHPYNNPDMSPKDWIPNYE